MRTRCIAVTASACAALALHALLAVSPAFALASAAAGDTSTLPDAPLVKTAPVFDVQLWPEETGVAIVVNATVATETPLPVKVRLPVPAGATVDWVGEILGGAAEQDIRVAHRLIDDGKTLEMVLTTARTVQYEARYAQPTEKQGLFTSRLEWVQTVPSSQVRFAVRVAAALHDVTVTPPSKYAPQFNNAGERLYVLGAKRMGVGDKTAITVSYRVGSTPPGSLPAARTSPSTLVGWLIAILGVILVVLLLVLRRQSRRSGRG